MTIVTTHEVGKRMIAGLALVLATAATTPSDEAAIRQIETAQQAAWNAHDARGYAAGYADDAQFLSARGQRWSGRAEIERKIAFAFNYGSLRIDAIDIRPVSDTAALATLSWTIAGKAIRHGLQTQLLQKAGDGRWLIVASQDTATPAEGAAPTPAASPEPVQPVAKPAKSERPCLLANRDGKCMIHK